MTSVLGWCAIVALTLALAMTPISSLSRRPLVRARRLLGISAALFAIAHSVLAVVTYVGPALGAVLSVTWLRSGVVALALLVPLLVTSFPHAVRASRMRLWKVLHRLVYVAAALACHHVLTNPFPSVKWALSLSCIIALTFALRFAPRRLWGLAENRDEPT